MYFRLLFSDLWSDEKKYQILSVKCFMSAKLNNNFEPGFIFVLEMYANECIFN